MVLPVPQVIQGQQAPKEIPAHKARPVQQDHKGLPEPMALLAQQVIRASKGRQVRKALKAIPVRRVKKATQVTKAQWVRRALMAQLGPRGQQELRVTLENKDLLDRRGLKVTPVRRVKKVIPEHKDPRVVQEHKGRWVHRVPMEQLEPQGQTEPKVLQAPRALQVLQILFGAVAETIFTTITRVKWVLIPATHKPI
jgi:hypothetical protein